VTVERKKAVAARSRLATAARGRPAWPAEQALRARPAWAVWTAFRTRTGTGARHPGARRVRLVRREYPSHRVLAAGPGTPSAGSRGAPANCDPATPAAPVPLGPHCPRSPPAHGRGAAARGAGAPWSSQVVVRPARGRTRPDRPPQERTSPAALLARARIPRRRIPSSGALLRRIHGSRSRRHSFLSSSILSPSIRDYPTFWIWRSGRTQTRSVDPRPPRASPVARLMTCRR
jgi:hypothetical protein